MQKPYLKKYKTIGDFAVWIVDGEYVRDNISVEFSNFGQHYRFSFIPKMEFWIDKERAPDEIDFYIDHLLVEYRFMEGGAPYSEAIEKADKKEKRERMNALLNSSKLILKKPREKVIIEKIHQKLLDEYGKDLAIWVVDGNLVRDIFFIDFTEGGHDKVYDFIPAREVWVDNDLSPHERKFVILHELHERYFMFQGLSYQEAHKRASYVEVVARHHSGTVDSAIKKELDKNIKLN